jgi:hypothetical protein
MPRWSRLDGAVRHLNSGGNEHDHKDRIKQRNLLLLDLASEPSNVSRNCKVLGFSGQCF